MTPLMVVAAAWLLVQIARTVEPTRGWALDGHRPWSCDLCMSFWTTLLLWMGAHVHFVRIEVLPWLAAAGGCLLLHRWLSSRPPPGGFKS